MKKYIIFPLLALFALTSCTEVIDIPLEDADKQVVVQASLYNTPGFSQVILNQSGSYYEPGEYPALSGANVVISDDAGNSFLLEESRDGVYSLPTLAGEENTSYHLEVEYEGETFEANSRIKTPIQIDSVSYEVAEASPFSEAGWMMQVHFTAENQADTYLRFRLVVNDTILPQIFLYDGNLPRGGPNQYRFITASVQSGDQVQIITEVMDKETYRYFDQLAELTGDAFGPPSAAPANPKGNLKGGALGYFAAVAASVKVVIVP